MQVQAEHFWYFQLVREMEDVAVGLDIDPEREALQIERYTVIKPALEYLLKINTKNLEVSKMLLKTAKEASTENFLGKSREKIISYCEKEMKKYSMKIEMYQKCIKQEQFSEEITKLIYQSGHQEDAEFQTIPNLSEDEREKISQQNFAILQETVKKIEEKYGFDKKT